MMDKKDLTKDEKNTLGKIRKIVSDAKKQSLTSYCLICGKPCTKFCNSHTVPEFVLRNIAVDGHVMSSIVNLNFIPVDDIIRGVKKSGIIHRICSECDNTIFKNYENPSSLLQKPSNHILNSIALKTTLNNYSKKLDENKFLEYTQANEISIPFERYHDIDKREIKNTLNGLIKTLNGKKNINNKLVFWQKLNYVVPIACQVSLVLSGDLSGHVINNIFDTDSHHKMQPLYIGIFPLEKSSVVMLFHSLSDNNYNAFDSQFLKLNLTEQLELISYMVLLYTEEYFLSPKLQTVLDDDSNEEVQLLLEAAQDMHMDIIYNELTKREYENREMVKLKNRKPIANFLGKKLSKLTIRLYL